MGGPAAAAGWLGLDEFRRRRWDRASGPAALQYSDEFLLARQHAEPGRYGVLVDDAGAPRAGMPPSTTVLADPALSAADRDAAIDTVLRRARAVVEADGLAALALPYVAGLELWMWTPSAAVTAALGELLRFLDGRTRGHLQRWPAVLSPPAPAAGG